jgi:hypothetical protein
MWGYGGINYLLDICRVNKEGQIEIDLQISFELVTIPVFAVSRYA